MDDNSLEGTRPSKGKYKISGEGEGRNCRGDQEASSVDNDIES